MTITLDSSSMGNDADGNPQSYTIARCSECSYWNAFAWSRESALRSAADHEHRVHRTRDAERRLNRILATRPDVS